MQQLPKPVPAGHAAHPGADAFVPAGRNAKSLEGWPLMPCLARDAAAAPAARARLASYTNGLSPRAARAAFTSSSASQAPFHSAVGGEVSLSAATTGTTNSASTA